MVFYRYEIVEYASMDGDLGRLFPRPKVELKQYTLIKETEKGYWISKGLVYVILSKKWVSKTAKKRYAYPTKEEALINFIKRTERRHKILSHQTTVCSLSIDIAKKMLNNLKVE